MSTIDWVPISQFAIESGMSKSVVAGHVGVGGDWPEYDVWLKLPNHSILISKSGYNRWLDTVAASIKRQKHHVKSSSSTKRKCVESALNVNQLMQTLEK